MYNVNKVEIVINNLTNKKEIILAKEKYDELFRIIRLWHNNKSSSVIDGEEYIIKIYTDKNVDILQGKGQYPDNYNEFIEWLSGLDE